jgi:trans-2,3-dihydro-3-hydroxyanthranilate isomerase
MRLDFLLLDVFTNEKFKGNPLAVVTKADGLLDDQMQAIAREFNLSETVFLSKPKSERHSSAVRIFTPTVELPFAGHPTIGAAVVLGLQLKVSAVRLEEQIGLITAVIEKPNKHSAEARFALPTLPAEIGKAPEKGPIALALGLEPDMIGCGQFAPAVYSAGVPFYLIPVRNAAVLRRIELNTTGWANTFPIGRHSIYVFTETPEEPDNNFAARMFSIGMGIREDPGTGSAAAALIGLLAKHSDDDGAQVEYVLRQGREMGRPSRLSLQFRKSGGALVHGGIGGHAVIVGEGCLDLGS